MKEFAFYLLKSGLWIAVFWAVYWFFLRKETFFWFNRIFLLTGLLSSLVLPFLQYTYDVTLNLQLMTVPGVHPEEIAPAGFSINWLTVPVVIYVAGMVVLLLRHLIGLGKIRRLILRQKMGNTFPRVVNTSDIQSSFSFFGYVFLDVSSINSETERRLILEHETAHVVQRHWVDLLVSQLICAVQWFNPFVWLYLQAIKQNHEFLADQTVLQKGNSAAVYHAALINYTLKTPVFALANSFAQYNKFKRINMMKKNTSRPVKKFAVLLLVPALALFLWAFAKPEYKLIVEDNHEMTTTAYMSLSGDAVPNEKVTVAGYGKMRDSLTTSAVSGTRWRMVSGGEDVKKDSARHQVIVTGYQYTIDDSSDKPDSIVSIQVNMQAHTNNPVRIDKDNQARVQVYNVCKEDTAQLTLHVQSFSMKPDKGNTPLIIVDGEVISSSIEDISPDSIESISVLKDGSAKEVYGSEGKNGVILITTKKKK